MLAAAAVAAMATVPAGAAEKKYGPGVSDTEIKIGNTMPYSGPASALGLVGKVIDAYFTKINDAGGLNGRKLTFLSVDDGFQPPKTVEAARRLVEQDNVAFLFATMGTAPSSAIQKYVNSKKVPLIFLISSASKWDDPKNSPWTISFPWSPHYPTEARIDVRYVESVKPGAKFAVLYQNDDAGKEYMRGVRETLGADAEKRLVRVESFEVTDPTVFSQVISLKESGADAFLIYSVTPKGCSQAIRKSYDLGWKAIRVISGACLNIDGILKPAGLDAAEGLVSVQAMKQVAMNDTGDPEVADYLAFMKKYSPDADPTSFYAIYGYTIAQGLEVVLKQAGDDLTRENIMKQAANLRAVKLGLLLPGITLNTSPTDFAPIKDAYMARFDGTSWVPSKELLHGSP
jgi:ABC-type branched-subunit amino acid transport system substrate-binding protein